MTHALAPAAARPATPRPAATVLRRCACGGQAGPSGECAECRAKRVGLQRSASSAAAPGFAPPLVHDVLRSPGQPLDAGTRAELEPRFGHSFADVRVHADGRAAESAAAVSAHAYTVGRDVVFGAGRYAPASAEGRRLIAHELAHVVQQSAGGGTALQARLEVGAADAPEEREADRAADAVLRAGPVPFGTALHLARSPAAVRVWRQPTHPDPGCNDLLAQIVARIAELAIRAQELIVNRLNLPPTGPMSIDGHQQQFRNKQVNLRRMLEQWDTNNCGPGYLPGDAWKWATRPAPSPAPTGDGGSSRRTTDPVEVPTGPSITPEEVGAVVGAGVGTYILYRVVRMLPSLLPPLWWTIPANAAAP
jgi:hypothetical protein